MTTRFAMWTTAALGALLAAAATAAPLAYVSNEGSSTVSVVDAATDSVTATLKVGDKPRGIAVDGQRLYISDQTANALVDHDLAERKQVAKVELGSSPEAIYLSPDAKLLSAAIEASARDMALTPDGRKLYVACGRSNAVAAVDTESYKKIADSAVGELPWGVAIAR